jgi:hypothetical protein
MVNDSSSNSVEYFQLLQSFWPDLYGLAVEAEQNAEKLPDFSAIRLRSFPETMVDHLFRHHDLSPKNNETQFDRLLILQKENLLGRQILALLHTIRKLGNIAAHGNRPVLKDEAWNLVDDARALTAWFCLHMKPDIDWTVRRSSLAIMDLSRFDAAPLIAFTATKEIDYGTETDGRIPQGCGAYRTDQWAYTQASSG